MRKLSFALVACAGLLSQGLAHATEDFVPEVLSVEEQIAPGPNVFVLNQSWQGASSVTVLSVDDLSTKGNLSMGIVGQMALSRDFSTAYTVSAYAERIMYGPTEAVLQEFDVNTLTLRREIIIPDKMAQVAPSSVILALSADERYAFVQNATPATSVSVVDLEAGEFLTEIPTPGCYGIYPATEGAKFSTLCGDGTLVTFTQNRDGTFGAPVRSAQIFDVDEDALFIHAERVGRDLVFVSFGGNVYRISDRHDDARLVERFSITDGVEGDWAPGGVDVTAYNPEHNILFVTMHSGAYEGSHKDAAEEVWAVDLRRKSVLYRSHVEHLASIVATRGSEPVLFGLSEEGELTRYEVDPEARFALKPAGALDYVGGFAVYAVTSE